jgi:hypothetical protein
MADVFISYASEDRDRARSLASALESHGWSVWWDRKIVVGQTFDQIIDHELEAAKSVVVLWSGNSISSEWVKNEAAAAAERGVLVPALIENVRLPLEFRGKQTANLIGWNGDPYQEGFQMLCDGVATIIPGVGTEPTTLPPRSARRNWRQTSPRLITAIGGILTAVVILVVTLYQVGVLPLKQGIHKAFDRYTYELGWSGAPIGSIDQGFMLGQVYDVKFVGKDRVTLRYKRPSKDGKEDGKEEGKVEATLTGRKLVGDWSDVDGKGELELLFDESYSRAEGWWNFGGLTQKYNIFMRRVK